MSRGKLLHWCGGRNVIPWKATVRWKGGFFLYLRWWLKLTIPPPLRGEDGSLTTCLPWLTGTDLASDWVINRVFILVATRNPAFLQGLNHHNGTSLWRNTFPPSSHSCLKGRQAVSSNRVTQWKDWRSFTFSFVPSWPRTGTLQNMIEEYGISWFFKSQLTLWMDGDGDKLLLYPVRALRKYLSMTELFVWATKWKKGGCPNTAPEI